MIPRPAPIIRAEILQEVDDIFYRDRKKRRAPQDILLQLLVECRQRNEALRHGKDLE